MGRDPQVRRRGLQTPMPEQELDGAQVGTGLEQMNCERMAERMWRNRLGEARASGGGRACTLDRSSRDRHLGALAGKEPVGRLGGRFPATCDARCPARMTPRRRAARAR